MSVRREVLLALGGIRDNYPGTCLREESDMFLRVRQAGHRIVYTPSAVVTHVAAPYVHGRRFDLRYHYYGHRNHIVLLTSTIGTREPADPPLRRQRPARGHRRGAEGGRGSPCRQRPGAARPDPSGGWPGSARRCRRRRPGYGWGRRRSDRGCRPPFGIDSRAVVSTVGEGTDRAQRKHGCSISR
jgi:hypothetical protein